MSQLEQYLASKRPQPRCPFCDCSLTADNTTIREGKQILSSVPIKEDSTSITYMQRTRMYKYRCCKKCNKTEKLMSTSNKFLYYTGTALIGIGFFIQTIILFIGVGCIFLAILAPFIIAKVSGRKYGVDYERVIKSGALIDEKKTM